MIRPTRRRAVALVTAALSLAVAGAAVAVEAEPAVIDWRMDEPAGSSVMLDSGAGEIHGQVGSGVVTGRPGMDGGVGYQWPFVAKIGTVYLPERLVTVPDNSGIDPDGSTFRVELALRTKQAEKNIMNKGQSGNKAGFWKIETGQGKVKCVFRGPLGGLSVQSRTVISDDLWHTVTCEHTPTSLTMTVDGQVAQARSGVTGTINNRLPLSIGGKSKCDQVNVDCDYYSGWIDGLRISKTA